MNNLNFTVVIPLFNKEKHILRTLRSVTSQKYPAAEVIIIDDGSTDKGPDLVKKANIPNVRLIQQANQGVSAARNNGVKLAKHEYIAFLDADDQWFPLFLDEVARLIMKFPEAKLFGTRYQIVETDGNFVDAKIKLVDPNPYGFILDNYFDVASDGDLPFTMSSIVIEKALFTSIRGFPLNEPIGEDQELFCRAALKTNIAYSPNIYSLYHKDVDNQASKNNIPSKECGFSIRLSDEARYTHCEKLSNSMLKYSATHLCHLAKLNINKGLYTEGRKLLKDPRCKLKPKHVIFYYGLSYLLQIKMAIKDLITAARFSVIKVFS